MTIVLQHIKASNQASRSRAGVLALLCVLLAGCEKEDYKSKAQPLRTVLFYMGGDNNLSSEVNAKIEQIKAAPLSPECRVVVYSDTRDGNPQLSELIMESGELKMTVVREYDECNSVDAEAFGAVLREVQMLYPAPSYGLALFSHASGLTTRKNVGMEDSETIRPPESRRRTRGKHIDGYRRKNVDAVCHLAPLAR